MIKINAGQGKSTQEVSIVVGRIINEIEPPECVVIAKIFSAGCPAEDIGIEKRQDCVFSALCPDEYEKWNQKLTVKISVNPEETKSEF